MIRIRRDTRTVPRNVSKERCLVCCPPDLFPREYEELLSSLDYEVKIVNTAAETLRGFFDIKPDLFMVHHTFLPPSPHRLLQMFRLADRSPAVLIMADEVRQVWRYLNLKYDACIEFMSLPLTPQELAYGVKQMGDMQKITRRRLFYNDLMTLGALALPMAALLAYLLIKG